ncbi:unnamed protein product [Calypogeia fissa]
MASRTNVVLLLQMALLIAIALAWSIDGVSGEEAGAEAMGAELVTPVGRGSSSFVWRQLIGRGYAGDWNRERSCSLKKKKYPGGIRVCGRQASSARRVHLSHRPDTIYEESWNLYQESERALFISVLLRYFRESLDQCRKDPGCGSYLKYFTLFELFSVEATKAPAPAEMDVFASVEMFADAGPLFFEEFFSGYGQDFMEVGHEDNNEDTHDLARVVLGEGISNAPVDTEDMESGGTARPVSQLQDVPLAGDTIPRKLDADSDFLAEDMDNGGIARLVS